MSEYTINLLKLCVNVLNLLHEDQLGLVAVRVKLNPNNELKNEWKNQDDWRKEWNSILSIKEQINEYMHE